MPPEPVVIVQPSYQYDSNVQIAKVIPRKKNLIVSKSPKEILFLMYLTDPRISSNQEVLKEGITWRQLEYSRNCSISRIDNFDILNGRRFYTE